MSFGDLLHDGGTFLGRTIEEWFVLDELAKRHSVDHSGAWDMLVAQTRRAEEAERELAGIKAALKKYMGDKI